MHPIDPGFAFATVDSSRCSAGSASGLGGNIYMGTGMAWIALNRKASRDAFAF